MIDFLLGIYLAGLVARGWLRGFVREVLDLVGLVVGVVLAFRTAPLLGDFLADRFGMSPEMGRLGSGFVVFLLVGLGLSLAAASLSRVMNLPGLNLANRLGGAVVAVAWGLLVVVVMVSLARALPLPGGVDQALDSSRVVEAVTGPDSLPQQVFQAVAADQALEALLALAREVGERRVVLEPDEQARIPPADPAELQPAPQDEALIFQLVNQERVAARGEPLQWSERLAEVARAHAREMYELGYVGHFSPRTGTAGDRVAAAGIRLALVGENLALASSGRAVHEGLMASEGHRANILHPDFHQVGIGAVQGPLGLMVVQVFGGG